MNAPYPAPPERCECDWKAHEGQPCLNEPYDPVTVVMSPALCIPCLHICCGERDDEADAREYAGRHRAAEVNE